MMEQEESIDFKTLKARFQGENGLKIQTKPTIPDKPKSIPPPTKTSNPLISSINAAVNKGTFHAPRVVFKDDKNLSRQLSPPWGLKTRENQPINNAELLDNNPKKEVDTVKKNLKDKKLPLVLPVSPKKAETPESASSPLTPESVSPFKVSTPKKFEFIPQKNSKNECKKTDPVKEVGLTKKSLKDRNFPLVLPVPPKKSKTLEPESRTPTPESISPGRVSTPNHFIFTTQKTSKDENEKADTAREVNIAKESLKDRNLPLVLPLATIKATPEPEPSPYTPVSNSPADNFVFTTQKNCKDEIEKTDTVARPTPAIRTPAPSHSAPAGPLVTANPPMESVPVVPKAVVPSQTSAGAPPVPDIPAPTIPVPSIPTSASPEPNIPEPAIPTPVIPSQDVPKSKTSKPGTSSSAPFEIEPLKPNIHLLSLSEVFPPPQESPPPEFTDIPPPVLYEDFPDEDLTEQAIPTPAIRTSIGPAPRNPDNWLASPAPTTPPVVSPEPLEYTPGPDSRLTVSSPPPNVHTPAAPVDKVLENAKALTDNIKLKRTDGDQSSSKPLSALSVLARAEEMASVKRTPNDSRIFNLLERAKRKTTVTQLATTPENTTPIETATPKMPLPETPTPLPETVTTEVTQSKLATPEKASPQLVTVVEPLPEETPPVPEEFDILELPPVDYVSQARLLHKTQPPETSKNDGLEHRVVTVVKQVNPPPPPPRKALPAIPIVDPQLEKPTHSPVRDFQIPTTPSEPLEKHEHSLHDYSFGNVFYEDVEEPEAPAVSTFRPPSNPSSDYSSRKPVSVHEEAFLKQLSPKNKGQEDAFLNTGNRDSVDVDYGSVSSLNPDTQVPVLQDSERSSPALSPSGTLERDRNVIEDQANSKKGKTPKNKKQKGTPKNPYADAAAAAVAAETPPKRLFSRKNSEKVADEKELKKKEKQREKEKEKEREREKREQKEKEKKENEMRKKFKITGQEEAIYHVKVIEDCKGRKNDLPVKVGDTVSIIRTDKCPKGKWLAKDSNNKYGYVPVESMDLNINGIMELGKMTTASNRPNGNGHKSTEVTSTNSRTSEHYEMNQSFSEDSEEWTAEDDDPVFGSPDETSHIGLNQSLATPAQGHVQPTQTDSAYTNVQPKQEALQRLSTFFMQPKTPSPLLTQDNNPIMPEPKPVHEQDPVSLNNEEEDLEVSELQFLPPPDLYADIIAGDSMPIYSKPVKLVSK
ncbi:proteoglycan 4 [Pseudorasbora parva]|uniref:proteoglycan 4 n=1 Tax=Pseudorasbora parva TaxID=51549 RepID=UPI00351E815C